VRQVKPILFLGVPRWLVIIDLGLGCIAGIALSAIAGAYFGFSGVICGVVMGVIFCATLLLFFISCLPYHQHSSYTPEKRPAESLSQKGSETQLRLALSGGQMRRSQANQSSSASDASTTVAFLVAGTAGG
jgi:hypothetical protein